MSKAPPPRSAPDVEYLTRDYTSYRELLIAHLDRSGTPWKERSAADAGMVLVEALAHDLDHLSYAGDAVLREGFLGTARRRESVAAHAALGDYVLSRGSTSRGYQHFMLQPGQAVSLPVGVVVRSVSGPAGHGINPVDDRVAFETTRSAQLDARRNRFMLERSVVAGSTRLWLLNHDRLRPDLWGLGIRVGTTLCVRDRDAGELVEVVGVLGHVCELAAPLRRRYLAADDDRVAEVLGNLVPIRQGRTRDWTRIGTGGVARRPIFSGSLQITPRTATPERHQSFIFALERPVVPGTRHLRLLTTAGQLLDAWAIGIRPGSTLRLRDADGAEEVEVAQVRDHVCELAIAVQNPYYAADQANAAEVLFLLAPPPRNFATGSAPKPDTVPSPAFLRRRIQHLHALQARAEELRPRWLTEPALELAWRTAIHDFRSGVRRLRARSVLDEQDVSWVEERFELAATGFIRILEALDAPVPVDLRWTDREWWPRQTFEVAYDEQEEPPLWHEREATLIVRSFAHGRWTAWHEVPDLLRSDSNDRHFAVEIARRGWVTLCFGDGHNGAMLPAGAGVYARWVEGDLGSPDVGRGALSRVDPVTLPAERTQLDTWLVQTENPVPTQDAAAPEPIESVPLSLRRNLQTQVIPITRADYEAMLEARPDVLEAVVLGPGPPSDDPVSEKSSPDGCQTCRPLDGVFDETAWPVGARETRAPIDTCYPEDVHVAVRPCPSVPPQELLCALREWAEEYRLAGTNVCVSLSREHHVSVELIVDVHPEIAPDDLRFRLRAALLVLLGNGPQPALGQAVDRADILRAAETVPGVVWSRVEGFGTAGGKLRPPRESIQPARDEIVRCRDEPGLPAAGTIRIWRAVSYTLELKLYYRDPDELPSPQWLREYLGNMFGGLDSVPMREGWDALTGERIDQRLRPVGKWKGDDEGLRFERLIHGDRAVDTIVLMPGDVPELTSAPAIRLVWLPRPPEKGGPCA